MGSKGTNTTTQTQSATPQALAAYNNLIGSAANAASAQYTPFTSNWASPVNSQQQLGISNINANAMSAQPYYQTALGYMQQAGSMAPTLANMGAQEAGNISGIGAWDSDAINGAGMAGASGILNAGQPINANNINQYLSPYTGQVVNATEAQFANTNAQQQQSVLGNAAAQGALGGDRVSVAQGILGGQQQAAEAPVIAGLYNTGYQQATQTAEQQQAAQLAAAQSAGQLGLGATEAAGNLNLGAAEAASGTQLGAYQSALQAANAAGYGIGNLGTAAQNSAISGATAQLGAGNEEEQLAYQQYLQQQGYPFQTLGWQAGIDTGVGGAEGGTGTTTAPAPSLLSQIGGAGLAGVGLLGGSGAFGSTGYLNPSSGSYVFSDRRLKENVHKIGETNDGQPIYRFQYKGHPQWHVGLIAQDVEKDHPEAVHEVGGYKAVDLKEATDDSARAFGGRVGLADGGSFGGTPYGDATGYVPQAPMIRGVGLPKAPSPQSMVQTPQQMIQGAAAIAKDFKKNSSGASTPVDLGYANYDNGVPTGIQGVGPFANGNANGGAIFKRGGLVQRSGLSRNGVPVRGGMGLSSFVPHFADGGTPYDQSYFDDEFANPIVRTGANYNIATNPAAMDAYAATASNDAVADNPSFVPTPMARPADAGVGDVTVADNDDTLPPQVTGPPGVGLAYSGAGPTGGLQAPDEQAGVAPQAAHSDSGEWKGLLGLPSDVRQSLMAAGLGMMASRSPFLGSAVGEGGLAGLAQYGALQRQKLAEQKEASDVDLRVKELNQRIKAESDLMTRESRPYSEMTAAQKAEMEFRQQTQNRLEMQPLKVGTDMYTGQDIYAVRDPKAPGGFRRIDMAGQTGTPVGTGVPVSAAPAAAPAPAPTGALAPAPVVGGALPPTSSPTAGDVPPNAREEVLAGVDPYVAAQVKALDQGRMAFPSGFAMKTPYWQTRLNLVAAYDPSFDAVNYNARAKARNDFTSGKSAANITSFNTAIGHLDNLDKSIDALNNTAYPAWNRVANWSATQTGDINFQKAQKDFMAAKQAVTDELTRAFRGSGGNVHDIVGWEQTLNEADSPQALHEAVKTAVNLLRSRVESVGDQYNRGMGTTRDPLTLLSPHAQDTVGRLTGEKQQAPSVDPRDASALRQNANNPAAAAAIDKKYGAGTAARLLGAQ